MQPVEATTADLQQQMDQLKVNEDADFGEFDEFEEFTAAPQSTQPPAVPETVANPAPIQSNTSSSLYKDLLVKFIVRFLSQSLSETKSTVEYAIQPRFNITKCIFHIHVIEYEHKKRRVALHRERGECQWWSLSGPRYGWYKSSFIPTYTVFKTWMVWFCYLLDRELIGQVSDMDGHDFRWRLHGRHE